MKRLIFFFTFTIIFISSIYAQPKREIRGVWLTINYALDWPRNPAHSRQDIERQKADLDQMLDKFEQTGINMIFFQTRLRGDVIYPSKIEPTNENFSSGYASAEYDPLAYAVEACHRRGMECHAWMVVYPVGNKKKARYEGMAKSYNGGLYLDPGNPNTIGYLVSLIREVVSEYDIDGIHFDYVRYPDRSDKFPDKDTYARYGNGEDKAGWRRENINRFVYAAYDEVKALKPWVQVSSSVVGMYDRLPDVSRRHWTAFRSVYQDPADWLAKGKHDFIVPMMYYSGELFFPFVDDWLERSNGRFIVPGLGLYQMDDKEFGWEPDVLLEQIRYSRDRQTQGNVFFRARYLSENKKGICDEIASRFYTTPAILPAMTWLCNSVPEAPKQVYAHKTNDFLSLSWDDCRGVARNALTPESSALGRGSTTLGGGSTTLGGGSTSSLFYNLYRSETFPVDINNPHNLIAARLENNRCEIPVDDRYESGYYYVVTSYDRYHNESVASNPVYFVTGNFDK